MDGFCPQKIEALLPPKPSIEIPEGEMVEEVNMDDYVATRREEGGSRGHAYQEVTIPYCESAFILPL